MRLLLINDLAVDGADILSLIGDKLFSSIDTIDGLAKARPLLAEQAADYWALIIINSHDANQAIYQLGEHLITQTYASIIIICPKADWPKAAAKLIKQGIMLVAKPLSKSVFIQSLHIALANHQRILGLLAEKQNLQRRIVDIKSVEKAKYVLMAYLHMTEPAAHAFIERQAMNMRISKREVAEGIIRTYLN